MLIAFLNSLAGMNGAYPDAVYHALIVLGVVLLTAALAGYWRIFEKMGEPGWKALVPIYSNWIIFDRCSEFPHMFFVYLVAGVVEFAGNFGVFGMFSASVEEWARIVCSGTELYMFYGLARCFGKGWGTTLGLWLAEFAFAPLLGFGAAHFVGRRASSAAGHAGQADGRPRKKAKAAVAAAASDSTEADAAGDAAALESEPELEHPSVLDPELEPAPGSVPDEPAPEPSGEPAPGASEPDETTPEPATDELARKPAFDEQDSPTEDSADIAADRPEGEPDSAELTKARDEDEPESPDAESDGVSPTA